MHFPPFPSVFLSFFFFPSFVLFCQKRRSRILHKKKKNPAPFQSRNFLCRAPRVCSHRGRALPGSFCNRSGGRMLIKRKVYKEKHNALENFYWGGINCPQRSFGTRKIWGLNPGRWSEGTDRRWGPGWEGSLVPNGDSGSPASPNDAWTSAPRTPRALCPSPRADGVMGPSAS